MEGKLFSTDDGVSVFDISASTEIVRETTTQL